MLKALDALYRIAGAIAALAILAICLVVSAQVSLNILARIGGPSLSFTIPSYADFAGYALATATFMAMAYTLRSGTHIRVNLVITRLPERTTWALELAALAVAAAMTGYATWFAGSLLLESLHYGDMSTGIIAIPLWIPQTPMVLGLGLLTVALLHTLAESLAAGRAIIADQGGE